LFVLVGSPVRYTDIANIIVFDRIKRLFGDKKVVPYLAEEDQILKSIKKYYQYAMKLSDIIAEIESQALQNLDIDEDNQAESYQNPIVRLVEGILVDAVQSDASDIHIEPDEYFVRVRCRVDGMLINRVSFHNKYWGQVLGRVKIMASLNIAESRKPQDGSISMNINEKKIDFRVSSLPTVHGENIVLRILDCDKSIVPIKKLGFSPNNSFLVDLSMAKPEGIIIVTGPTGSGKTTTLYSIVDSINKPDINIMTLEDPVEYSLSGIRQTQINVRAGLDFASGLRSILRQDPDVIFIGEIRDFETADIAVKSSLTGHKVLSTLHTNDAMGAIYRLVDIGIKPFLIASSLTGVVAQRLVRRLCNDCKISYDAGSAVVDYLNKSLGENRTHYTLCKSKGCSNCYYTGYKGRVAVVEVINVNEEIAQLISVNAPQHEVLDACGRNSFLPMANDGIYKLAEGSISIDSLKESVNVTNLLRTIESYT
jgi:type II secretory ATPase GspE/PulE/Tfp pilus assembly ATPase PilB-like protein